MNTASINVAADIEEGEMTALMPVVDAIAPPAPVSSQRLLAELPREKLAWMLQRMCEIRYFE